MYNPANWYWIVAGSTTRVYSSARADFVPVEDETYQAWLQLNPFPTRIESIQSLFDVLEEQAPEGLPADSRQGIKYRENFKPEKYKIQVDLKFNPSIQFKTWLSKKWEERLTPGMLVEVDYSSTVDSAYPFSVPAKVVTIDQTPPTGVEGERVKKLYPAGTKLVRVVFHI